MTKQFQLNKKEKELEKQLEKEFEDVFAQFNRIYDDDEYQLELTHPIIREMLVSAPAYDKDPNGSGPFGFSLTNPIPVNGPIGQLAYLSKLETQSGQGILFHRIGAISKIDVFEAVTLDGAEWFIFYLDLYHPRRSRLAPDGLVFTKELGQFSGFHRYCSNFPYDFLEMMEQESESGLIMAYISTSKVEIQIKNRVFNRPMNHNIKLGQVLSRLSSRQT